MPPTTKPGIAPPIPVAEALDLILGRVPVLGHVTLSARRADGHALASDITAGADVPPFDSSAMDGYAVTAGDLHDTPVSLRVAGETAAGDPPGGPLRPGEAHAIMTGAPVPPGAGAVVPIEATEEEPGGKIRIQVSPLAGANIRKAGSDIRKGTTVLGRGHALRPFELGVLASLGIGFVTVHRRPSVSLVSTGNELVEPGRPLAAGKIRESNSSVLAGMLGREGCDVRHTGITRDDPAELALAISAGLGTDMLITMGGVSAGRYDFLPRLFSEAGVEPVFHRVNIRPGMPLWFGMKGGVPVFGLPGNPVSAAVTFSQFVRPAILRMSGRRDPGEKIVVKARLETGIEKTDGKRHFVRGILRTSGEGPTVTPAGKQDSHAGSVLARANCLIIVPEETRSLKASEMVDAEVLS